MPKYIGLLLVTLFTSGTAFAQQQSPGPYDNIRPLHIGDTCPDLVIRHLLHFPTPEIKLSALKGKLIIIDFWATWCPPCVKGLPDFQDLEMQFPGQLVVLPVTTERKEIVQEFCRKNKLLQNKTIRTATQDTVLRKTFRHFGIPHEVWLDEHLKVVAITSHLEVNRRNLEQYFSGKPLAFPEKTDILDFDIFGQPLLLGGLGNDFKLPRESIQYSSLLTEEIKGLPGARSFVLHQGRQVRVVLTNFDITGIYRAAFINQPPKTKSWDLPQYDLMMRARTVLEVRDSSIFIWPGKGRTPVPEKHYCYELILPEKDSLNWAPYMLADLNRYFGAMHQLEAVKEKRKVTCWALVRTSTEDRMRSTADSAYSASDTDLNHLVVRRCPLRYVVYQLQSSLMADSPIPIIDDTHYDFPVDLDIHAKLDDPLSLSEALKPYGLALVKKDAWIDMIVIRSKNQPPL